MPIGAHWHFTVQIPGGDKSKDILVNIKTLLSKWEKNYNSYDVEVLNLWGRIALWEPRYVARSVRSKEERDIKRWFFGGTQTGTALRGYAAPDWTSFAIQCASTFKPAHLAGHSGSESRLRDWNEGWFSLKTLLEQWGDTY